jgi:hypothetical protein
MSSNSERLRLAQIEAELREDDPEFVQRFVHTERGVSRRPRPGMTARTWWVIAAAAVLGSWALDSAVLVVIALTAISVALCMWSLQADLRDGPPDGER